MSDDLEARLRGFRHGSDYMDPDLSDAAADRLRRYREALTKIAEGDVPRPTGQAFRRDDKPSKHDRCIHGAWMYDDCGSCIEDFARQALSD